MLVVWNRLVRHSTADIDNARWLEFGKDVHFSLKSTNICISLNDHGIFNNGSILGQIKVHCLFHEEKKCAEEVFSSGNAQPQALIVLLLATNTTNTVRYLRLAQVS